MPLSTQSRGAEVGFLHEHGKKANSELRESTFEEEASVSGPEAPRVPIELRGLQCCNL